MNLTQVQANQVHIIKDIVTDNQEMVDFLFTLGCYEGEQITVISKLSENYVITIKDARYSIGETLAEAIII